MKSYFNNNIQIIYCLFKLTVYKQLTVFKKNNTNMFKTINSFYCISAYIFRYKIKVIK